MANEGGAAQPADRLTLASLWRLGRDGVVDWIYPPRCSLCRHPWSNHRDPCCPSCRELLRDQSAQSCPRCASDQPSTAGDKPDCPSCIGESFSFERILRMGAYEGALREVVLMMKQPRHENLAFHMGRLWWQDQIARGQAPEVDVIIPIPIHWTRRLLTGYNQAEALAEGMSAEAGRPVQIKGLKKRRFTLRQAELSGEKRRLNVHRAFAVRLDPLIKGKRILLVDDVVTTCSTVQSATTVLKKAGADRVIIACLARARN